MKARPRAPFGIAASLRRVAPFFAPFRGALAVLPVLAFATAGLSALEPLVMKPLFDGVASGGRWKSIVLLLVALITVVLLREVLSGVFDWLTWRVRVGANQQMLAATVERLHALPISYHREEGVGAIRTKVERGINGAVDAFSNLAFHLLPGIVYLGILVVVMFRLDVRLALLVLAATPVPALIGLGAASEQTVRERRLMDRWTVLFRRFHEVFAAIIVVRSYAREEDEMHRFMHGVDCANAVVVRGVARDTAVGAAKNLVVSLVRVAVIAVGGYLVMHQRITFGTLVAFLAYVGGVFGPVQALTGLYQTLRKGTVAVETVCSILDAEGSLPDATDARDPGRLRGEVVFDRVSFAYRAGAPVVRDVSFVARPGETIALVGPSGAGKSTLMALLQRLYDPSQGAIRVDGHDVRKLEQRALRRQIGVVLQEGLLFSDTIHDNIAFGRPNATMAEIMAAAKSANAHEFIMALPNRYQTEVGDSGCLLSGGERQRVAIARALLRNPPILVLDEATSALDPENEALIHEALSRLRQGRTTFIIAHRLSTVIGADRILVLREGVVSEHGTHTELMQQGGYYASLVRRQVGGLVLTSPMGEAMEQTSSSCVA